MSKRTLFVLFYVPSDTSVQATSHAINSTSTSESSNVQIRLPAVHCWNCLQRCKLKNAVYGPHSKKQPAGYESVPRKLKLATLGQKYNTK